MGIYTGPGSWQCPGWQNGTAVSGSDLTRWILAISVIIVLQGLDLLSTRMVLNAGGVELNPLFAILAGTFWFWPVMSLAKIFFIAFASFSFMISDRYYPHAAWVAWGIILVQSTFVVSNNLTVLAAIT